MTVVSLFSALRTVLNTLRYILLLYYTKAAARERNISNVTGLRALFAMG